MSSPINKAGKVLRFGVPNVTGCIAQNATNVSGGELRVYKDENGNDISLYVFDKHKEATFDGLLEADQALKEIGDEITIGEVTGRITAWQVQWHNEEVARVSGTIRTYDLT